MYIYIYIYNHNCNLYDHAIMMITDQNNIDEICTKLKLVTRILMNWFQEINMQANPTKFKLIVFDKSNTVYTFPINDDIVLKSCMSVKLLGIIIDTRLCFTERIGYI